MDNYSQGGQRLSDYIVPEHDPAQTDFVERFLQVFRRLRQQQGPQGPQMPQAQPVRPQVLRGINPDMPPPQPMQQPIPTNTGFVRG